MLKERAQLEKAKKQSISSSWLSRGVRFSYVMRGILYILLGLLAFNQIPAPQLAISNLIQLPYGKYLRSIVIAGLAAYAFWGLIRALITKPLLERLGYLGSAAGYASIIFSLHQRPSIWTGLALLVAAFWQIGVTTKLAVRPPFLFLARFGYLGRALLFCLVGLVFITGINYTRYPVIPEIVGLGLVAFGVFSIIITREIET
ncbi:hypothetical protein M1403_00665 [Patescibacteria group bacterium]|nr:hypothetical protein [Patescibacteria group bacterium]